MAEQLGGRMSMNVQGVTQPNYANGVSGASPIAGGKFDSQFQGAMGDVASLLNMSGQQLAASLAQGGNLSSVAQSAGVSQSQLVSTIEKGLTDSGSKLTGTRLENIANRIANNRGLGHHHHHGGGSEMGAASANGSNGSNGSSVFSSLLDLASSSSSSSSSPTSTSPDSALWQATGINLTA
jgi:hypothetical protein